jgi:trimeric autotransporter adhesin
MADTKISGLTAITGADTAADDDFVVVDTSAAQTKRITRDELKAAVLNTGPLTIGGATIFSGAVSFNAIAETKSVTAVDVFVYDTSKDSDGGAWRNRTQATSWYNETLNTAARGSRKDFPAVAVIVAEAAKVTIYDGDDPDLPMWRVEDYTGLTLTSINAINGSMAVAASTGLILSSYVGDDIGSTTLDYTTATTPAIVNNAVNDVAMTVLPDAPIDPATGIQVPTIAVATNGGVSVIRDDGTVVDITNSSTNDYSYSVSFGANNFLNLQQGGAGPGAGWLYVFDEIPAADTVITNNTKTGSTASPIAYYAKSGLGHDLYLLGDPDHGREGDYIGTDAAIVALAENPDAPTNGMVAYVTSDYNTGWMNGDIKGAFLSDTDDTDLVGSGELVTNGTFDTDTSGWTGVGCVLSNNSGVMRITDTDGSIGYAQQLVTLEVGNTGTMYAFVGTSAGSSQMLSLSLASGAGTLSGTFIATSTNGWISMRNASAVAGEYWEVDNISVKLADADRSGNKKGLIVNGTVTRTPVATGADLVAYSGFSASNYLEQPYNSALDFGTGDFSVMGWVKQAANTAVETIIERDSATTAQRFTLAVNASGFVTFTCDDDTTARTATSNRVVDNDVWTHFVALYDGAGGVKIYLNGVLDDTETGSALLTLNNASAVLRVGLAVDDAEPLANADLALLRISATAPSNSQIEKIYNAETFLFQESAQATLYGASNTVTALAHDDTTGLLHVGTSAGRSVFQGLRRVSNTTTAVGTAISASNSLVVEE